MAPLTMFSYFYELMSVNSFYNKLIDIIYNSQLVLVMCTKYEF